MRNRKVEFTLDEQLRSELPAIALVRQKDAILGFQGRCPTAMDEEVRSWNQLGKHMKGEASEGAVSMWLEEAGIRVSRAASVYQEMMTMVPDITATVHGIKLDVKSSTRDGVYGCKHGQVKNDDKHAVVWCEVVYPPGFDRKRDYDTIPPIAGSILGWSTMAEVGNAPLDGEWHQIKASEVRSLETLLKWLRLGNRPPNEGA